MANRIEEIFHQHYSALCNYATAVVKDKMTAEDLVQNLFIQLWQNNKLDTIENPERFLLKATKFKCIDFLRSNKNKQTVELSEIEKPDYQTPSEISEADIDPLLHYFAAKLPPKTQMVFLKSRKAGMTYKEIAADMNISVKTVENQMGRALRQMKMLLKEHYFLSLFILLYG